MSANTLMLLGTSSSVGKSLLVTALCRILARRGVRVAPFKGQNMSNNAAVCADGAEIGRAQALQAAAAGIAPTADMNPVLLKPEAAARAQVIVQGRPWQTMEARAYFRDKNLLWPIVTAALDRLRAAYDLVIIEGAGSPVELNLRASDIVNLAVARYTGGPVLLAGDIDRGGIFAQLLGTLWLLSAEDRALVRGLIVNKFRGDPALFADGVPILEERSTLPVLGVIPYIPALGLPEEDAVALDEVAAEPGHSELDIAVIRLPHIANFDDFDPLRREPGVRLRYVEHKAALGRPRALILPGTKSTLADLAWLRAQELDNAILRLARERVAIVGICGGYQMLGTRIADPAHVESLIDASAGLGLLPIETIFHQAKATYQARARVRTGGAGWLAALGGHEIEGYEIHCGESHGGRPWLEIEARNGAAAAVPDGAMTADGRIWGCYLHGLFGNDGFRRAWLSSLGRRPSETAPLAPLDDALDRLADVVERSLDMRRLNKIIEGG
jgi:adenosylcobyric acid synthase